MEGNCGAQASTEPQSGPEATDELTLSQAELVDRIRWLIMLRWFAFAGVGATILIARSVFQSSLPWNLLLLADLTIPVYNLIFYVAWRRASRAGARNIGRASSRIANAQILCDLIVLGALIHLSGGVENPFGFYFVFHMVIAGILLSRVAAFAQATAAVAIFTFIALGEYCGILPHYDSPATVGFRGLYANPVFVLGATWVLTTSLYVVVFLATSIAARLRYREDQVALLTRRLGHHADLLQNAYDELARIEKAKSAYARKVAHELRSPLAAIDSLLRTVSEGLLGEVSEQAREMIARSRHRTHELLALVHDLLALAAARDAQTTCERANVDVREVMDDLIPILVAQADARRITLNVQISADLPPICADPEGIQQMITNLVSNAIKYSPVGGAVEIRISRTDSCVEITVSDQGIGIPQADLNKVFDEFYRAGNAREFASEGTGLGLAIVRSIVDSHSGVIEVKSQPGTGSTFTVRLPVESSRAES